MTQNVGGIDRILRGAIGLALIAWAFFGTGDYHLWGWIGIVPLFTAVVGWCPPYSLLGISTCKVSR
jgi:hypothetical protein